MTTVTVSTRITTLTRFCVYVCAFIVPLALNTNQIVTGTLVNCLLFLTVWRLSKHDQLPVALLPSLGALSHGILFGPQTVYLYYFLPFIWLGNYTLIRVFSGSEHVRLPVRLIISSVAKYLLLYTTAYVFVRMHVVPTIFLTAMGIVQLGTALLGAMIFALIQKSISRYDRR
jgi:hypothetical protein